MKLRKGQYVEVKVGAAISVPDGKELDIAIRIGRIVKLTKDSATVRIDHISRKWDSPYFIFPAGVDEMKSTDYTTILKNILRVLPKPKPVKVLTVWEQSWKDLWKGICTYENGKVNMEQVKKELSDYGFVMGEVSKVYMEITHGRMSKINYRADDVIGEYNHFLQEDIETAIKEDREQLLDDVLNLVESDIDSSTHDALRKLFKGGD